MSKLRWYESNIISNPSLTKKPWYFGIHTIEGWRCHTAREIKAKRSELYFSGDGQKTVFTPDDVTKGDTLELNLADDIHLLDENEFTDSGIYPTDPRIQYPVGTDRWAISHSLLYFLVADHNLYTHQYVWEAKNSTFQTFFHKHAELEEVTTDSKDGKTVKTANAPISATIEGNKYYPLQNSAVRGVWDNPEKKGKNYYARTLTTLQKTHNWVYIICPHTPILQTYGIWTVGPDDKAHKYFDKNGMCIDKESVIGNLNIPLHNPRIIMTFAPRTIKKYSDVYDCDMACAPHDALIEMNEDYIGMMSKWLGKKYKEGVGGYNDIGVHCGVCYEHEVMQGTYLPQLDINMDGVIDEKDIAIARGELGNKYRCNYYTEAYFGGSEWLSSGGAMAHDLHSDVICMYQQGAGYNISTGQVKLFDTPGPGKKMYIEYFYDAPAEKGENNIKAYLWHEA